MQKKNSKSEKFTDKAIEDNISMLVSQFASHNTEYQKNIFPINDFDEEISLPEYVSLSQYLRFKIDFADFLDLEDSEIGAFKELREIWETNGKKSFANLLDEIIEKFQSMEDILQICDTAQVFEDIIGKLEKSNSQFIEVFELLDKEANKIDKLNKEITDTQLSKAVRLKTAEKVAKQIGETQEKIISQGFKNIMYEIPLYLGSIKKRVYGSNSIVKDNYKKFVQKLDEYMYYGFVLLNCQKLRFHYLNMFSQVVIKNEGSLDSGIKMETMSNATAALLIGNKTYEKILPLHQKAELSLAKEFKKLVDTIKLIKPQFGKAEKLVYLSLIELENSSKDVQNEYYATLDSYRVAPTDLQDIAIEFLFKECGIQDDYDAEPYINNEIKKNYLNSLAVMLLTDIVRFNYREASLDGNGIYILEGVLGLKKKYFSKSDIYNMLNAYESNKNRYSIHKWIQRLGNLTDQDIWDYEIRQHENHVEE